jgi:hypothetical protein
MRLTSRILLFVIPLIVSLMVGLLYTYLNIQKQLFVDRLGCGCNDGFNTNSLSLLVFGVMVAGTAFAWWVGTRGFRLLWRWGVFGILAVLSVIAFRFFHYYNFWM